MRSKGHGKDIGLTLSSTQKTALKKMIMDKLPGQFKLDYVLWTRKAVQEPIDQEYSIKMLIRTVGD